MQEHRRTARAPAAARGKKDASWIAAATLGVPVLAEQDKKLAAMQPK